MTYKTRQEVLRAAADWMDVCEKSGVDAKCKCIGNICNVTRLRFDGLPSEYEFPLALLEGKEVWVGSELYNKDGSKVVITDNHVGFTFNGWSWNPPKPATVMVEMLVDDARFIGEAYETFYGDRSHLERAATACKKALENLK